MQARALALVILGLAFASEARAQWSAPSFLPPRPGDDIGIYFSTIEDFGIQAIWRQRGNLNLGVRGGWIEGPRHGGVVVGSESWGLLLQAGQGLPVDVAWTVGAGAVFGDGRTSLEVPVGLTVGRTVLMAPIALQFYGHPRLALIVRAESDETDETELGGLFDLGVDAITAGGIKLRLGATLGTFDALGLGLAISWGRAVQVR